MTYDDTISDAELHRLLELLPDIVGEGVDCEEEPWIGSPQKGDLQVRFHKKGPLDNYDLNCLIEVGTKLFPSRAADKQRRSDFIRDRLSAELDLGETGVWLVLNDGAWSKT